MRIVEANALRIRMRVCRRFHRRFRRFARLGLLQSHLTLHLDPPPCDPFHYLVGRDAATAVVIKRFLESLLFLAEIEA